MCYPSKDFSSGKGVAWRRTGQQLEFALVRDVLTPIVRAHARGGMSDEWYKSWMMSLMDGLPANGLHVDIGAGMGKFLYISKQEKMSYGIGIEPAPTAVGILFEADRASAVLLPHLTISHVQDDFEMPFKMVSINSPCKRHVETASKGRGFSIFECTSFIMPRPPLRCER